MTPEDYRPIEDSIEIPVSVYVRITKISKVKPVGKWVEELIERKFKILTCG